MKRLALSICICGLLALASAPASFGFAADFDYQGSVNGNPTSFVGFFVARTPNGSKQIRELTVTRVPYECRDAPAGVTAGWRFRPEMWVQSRRFEGRGEWIGLPLDPVGAVDGRLRRGGIAAGELKLRGELAGPGTHCRTGLLGWRAKKNPL